MDFEKEFALRLAAWDAAKAAHTKAYRAWIDDGYRDAAGTWIVNASVERTEALDNARDEVEAAQTQLDAVAAEYRRSR